MVKIIKNMVFPKNKNNSITIIISLILLVILGVAGFWYFKQKIKQTASLTKKTEEQLVQEIIEANPVSPVVSLAPLSSNLPSPLASPSGVPALAINFNQVGNLQNWDSQQESETATWSLLYEEPGQPALTVNLIFNEQSLCNLGNTQGVCNQNALNNGDRVKIEGSRTEETVTVIKLTKLQAM